MHFESLKEEKISIFQNILSSGVVFMLLTSVFGIMGTQKNAVDIPV
jgi:hypothetical protein